MTIVVNVKFHFSKDFADWFEDPHRGVRSCKLRLKFSLYHPPFRGRGRGRLYGTTPVRVLEKRTERSTFDVIARYNTIRGSLFSILRAGRGQPCAFYRLLSACFYAFFLTTPFLFALPPPISIIQE